MFTSVAVQWTKMKTEPACSGSSEDKCSDLHSELLGEKVCKLTMTTKFVNGYKHCKYLEKSYLPLARRPLQNLLKVDKEKRGL